MSRMCTELNPDGVAGNTLLLCAAAPALKDILMATEAATANSMIDIRFILGFKIHT
jgi:hypothetical protein